MILATEIFGWGATAPVLIVCAIASAVCGRRSIYDHQRLTVRSDSPTKRGAAPTETFASRRARSA